MWFKIVVRLPVFLLLPLAASLLSGCLFERGGENGSDVVLTDGDYVPAKPVAPKGWPAIKWPRDNSYSPAKDILGRRLFFDQNLSSGGDRACSWCHSPDRAFADVRGEPVSSGTEGGFTKRNSPTLANMAFTKRFMFDGRFESLEAQALGPLFDHNEMNMTEAAIVAYLEADTAYARLFSQAYGSATVTMDRVTKALATYQRTLISNRSAYDLWLAGDSSALSPSARRGEILFRSSRLGCASCHTPPLLTDDGFHNIGLDNPGMEADSGRAAVTRLPADLGRFKTPTLRNVMVTAAYMHDGRFETIDQVLDHYNSGGTAHPAKDGRIRPLGLTQGERADLVAFFEALTDSIFLRTPVYSF